MKYLIIILLAIPFSSFGQEVEIKQVLKDQIDCWNSGDLECYMDGYWRSDQLMFVGKNGITYGWESTLTMYKSSYPRAIAQEPLSKNVCLT